MLEFRYACIASCGDKARLSDTGILSSECSCAPAADPRDFDRQLMTLLSDACRLIHLTVITNLMPSQRVTATAAYRHPLSESSILRRRGTCLTKHPRTFCTLHGSELVEHRAVGWGLSTISKQFFLDKGPCFCYYFVGQAASKGLVDFLVVAHDKILGGAKCLSR